MRGGNRSAHSTVQDTSYYIKIVIAGKKRKMRNRRRNLRKMG